MKEMNTIVRFLHYNLEVVGPNYGTTSSLAG